MCSESGWTRLISFNDKRKRTLYQCRSVVECAGSALRRRLLWIRRLLRIPMWIRRLLRIPDLLWWCGLWRKRLLLQGHLVRVRHLWLRELLLLGACAVPAAYRLDEVN